VSRSVEVCRAVELDSLTPRHMQSGGCLSRSVEVCRVAVELSCRVAVEYPVKELSSFLSSCRGQGSIIYAIPPNTTALQNITKYAAVPTPVTRERRVSLRREFHFAFLNFYLTNDYPQDYRCNATNTPDTHACSLARLFGACGSVCLAERWEEVALKRTNEVLHVKSSQVYT
jgi:hypothetical protein